MAFLLTINTGVKPTALFNLNVKQLKYKKYLTVSKGITYKLNDEISELISIVCEGKKPTDLVFARQTFNNVSRYGYILLTKALENDSNDVYYLMNKAESLVGLKEYDNAIELLSKAIKIEPKHCGFLQVLSMAYINKKDFEKALKCMDKSLNICDCCAEHYIIRGYIEMQMEKFEDAIKDFEVVINSEFQTNPSAQEQLSAFINHSISNFKLNNIDNAIFDIEKSIELINDSTLKEDLEKLKENLSNKSANTEELYEKIVENYFSK